jgi:hypothetical protein
MLVENHSGTPDPAAARDKPSRNDSQRWLAELEREFLQATAAAPPASHGHAAARSSGPSSSRDASPDAMHASASDGAAHARGSAVADPTDRPREFAATSAQTIAAEATAAVPAAATGPAIALADGRPMSLPSTATPTDEPLPAIALPPSSAADRALGLRARPDAPAGAASRAPAPRYARQLMSLTEGEHASATIRDASLSAADSAKVAHSVSLQLQAAGLGVHRIFINGQRFDSTPSGVAPRPDRLPPLFQDDDA